MSVIKLKSGAHMETDFACSFILFIMAIKRSFPCVLWMKVMGDKYHSRHSVQKCIKKFIRKVVLEFISVTAWFHRALSVSLSSCKWFCSLLCTALYPTWSSFKCIVFYLFDIVDLLRFCWFLVNFPWSFWKALCVLWNWRISVSD